MPLVEYSDSEADDNDDEPEPSAKKRKTSSTAAALPPLPAIFRDLYSSTVRTSTQDDPSLHGGRKRVVPHVQGNWPTHVYLECKYSSSSLPIISTSQLLLLCLVKKWAERPVADAALRVSGGRRIRCSCACCRGAAAAARADCWRGCEQREAC